MVSNNTVSSECCSSTSTSKSARILSLRAAVEDTILFVTSSSIVDNILEWRRICWVSPLLLMNPRLHTLHRCGRSPIWKWKMKNDYLFIDLLKKLPFNVHFLDDSPEWIRLCAAKSPCWANDRLHVSQAYGFSPVCVRWWICSRNTREKLRPHRVHWCGFSPVCVLIIKFN